MAAAAAHLAFYLVIILELSLAFATTTTNNQTNNEECVGDAITLSFGVYENSCPEAEPIVFSWVVKAITDDPRIAASLLRLHFHDCFVNGCDASVLLDDTDNFVGEKTAAPNFNSLRGFQVIDSVKADIEFICPGVVSCADILAIAARDSVLLSGGPGWEVQTGRKDGLTASKTAANNNIPGPNSDVPTLLSKFQNVGLNLNDLVTLSGAHTMGKARCTTFSSRLNGISPNVNLDYLSSLQQLCSASDANATLAQLDLVTPSTFDNQYYVNLVSGEGLLPSDQALMTGDEQTPEIVRTYANDPAIFFEEFRKSMLKMGSLVKAGNGEIRRNCRLVNQI